MPDPTTVLLVMDFQPSVLARYDAARVLEAAGRAVAAARTAGVPVFFVRVAFRAGYPEVSATRGQFAGIRERAAAAPQDRRATEVHEALAPRPDEPVVTKRRISAFSGSDLDVLLRAYDARHLVLAGVSTSGVVLSTVRQAADLDLGLTVLADACDDLDPEVHRVLTEKVFPRQATVTTVADWASSLSAR